MAANDLLEHFLFLEPGLDPLLRVETGYSASLVVLSVLVAVFSSYIAFLVSGRLRATTDRKSNIVWLLFGSFSLGMGVWAMHFVGMLAYDMPLKVNYDVTLTVVSAIPAILASFVVLKTTAAAVSRDRPIVLQSLLMGVGIGLMHYIGMLAMYIEGSMYYDVTLFTLSIVIAVLLADIALRLKIWADEHHSPGRLFSFNLLVASSMMGIAVSGMHYTGMAAVEVYEICVTPVSALGWDNRTLAHAIAYSIFGLGFILILAVEFSHRLDLYRRIRDEEGRQRIILNSVGDAIVSFDSSGSLQLFNPAAESIFGYRAEEILGKSVKTLFPHNERDFARDLLRPGNWPDGAARTISGRRKDGSRFCMEINASPLEDSYGKGYVGVLRDITERLATQQKIQHQANFDALTDLPNRFLVFDRLSQQLSDAQRRGSLVAVIFLDLDAFKNINDTLGHEIGDRVLIEAAERLSDITRRGDSVGRLGGDEFILIAGGSGDGRFAATIAENILERFRTPFDIGNRQLMLTSSIGIAIYPTDGASPSELLRKADSAMYHSKEAGKNAYSFFTEQMNNDVSRRLQLEEHLHNALENGEFEIHYQPKVDLRRGGVEGAEALLRWQCKALGQVSPIEFIPICEQTGLIDSIGLHVLQEALEFTVDLHRQGYADFRMAINLSPRQLREANFPDLVRSLITEHGLPGHCLEFEITENILMDRNLQVDRILRSLSMQDITLAMDDFGTGYSALSNLRQYPFDVMKIDRSFIKDIAEHVADRELIEAAIAMAHAMNLKVVAEGVESAEQANCLRQLECDLCQGYYFGRPMPRREFLAFMQNAQKNTKATG